MSLTGDELVETSNPPSSPASTSKTRGCRINHQLIEDKKIRKRCVSCYAQMKQNEGATVARNKARKVYTENLKVYCEDCDGKPFLCVNCFNLKHID